MSSGRANASKGYLCVILAAIMWASSGTAGKALFVHGMNPFELVQVRVTLSTLIMGLVFGIFRRDVFHIQVRDLGYFLLLGCVGMALVQGSYFYTISKIQVAAAILVQYLAPIFVTIFSIFFWKERPTFLKTLALVLAFAGCYLVVGGYNLQLLSMNRLGILGGLVAALSFAAYTLLGERAMHRYRPWTVLFYAIAFSALSWNIFYHPFHYATAGFGLFEWKWILYIAVVGTILPFGLYFVGINYIRSTRASITATLEPISAGFIAFFVLGEALELLQLLGGVLVIGAIVLLQVQHEHDEMAPTLIRNRQGKAEAGT
ncbi:MAG: EamA family transporter [Deltaproteobacteria bacterium]|nr:EamA family transporter [Deltaproteobacteria bacterium]MBW1921231.1 EamA family transporter [Deltaproteobacteria bacterium]MBW1934159.1 EamA family transporter [Deltaproteobacteria bacterium]MBW1977161.1 EamA family transporter [Deltaproteobacteria bacterium]MBW2043607.1 EamA family transporter [Deltaproteobacteria bacterium]